MQALGLMHLARSGVVLRPSTEGDTRWSAVEPEQIIDLAIRMALAVAFPGPD
jgi:hypothetical protein